MSFHLAKMSLHVVKPLPITKIGVDLVFVMEGVAKVRFYRIVRYEQRVRISSLGRCEVHHVHFSLWLSHLSANVARF